MIFNDFAVLEGCKNVAESYGEICVHCNKCGRFDEIENIEKDVRTCRVCGCTDDHACPGGCYWVEEDLCSECVEADEEDIVDLTVNTLIWCPATDVNYKPALQRATDEQLREAIEIMKCQRGNKGRIAACERELRRRGKK